MPGAVVRNKKPPGCHSICGLNSHTGGSPSRPLDQIRHLEDVLKGADAFCRRTGWLGLTKPSSLSGVLWQAHRRAPGFHALEQMPSCWPKFLQSGLVASMGDSWTIGLFQTPMEHVQFYQPLARNELLVLPSINDHLSAFRLLQFHPYPLLLLLLLLLIIIITNYFPSQTHETWLQAEHWK